MKYRNRTIVTLLLFVSGLTASAFCGTVPHSNHVVVVVEENRSYGDVIGNASMPFLNSLANRYTLLTNYFANTHPSIGNYFMMTAGQIITNNDSFGGTVAQDNLVRRLLVAGKTWKSYDESLPAPGFTGGGAFPYAKRHNPFAYFTDVRNSSVQRNFLVPFSEFGKDLANNNLPAFSFVVPNVLDDAHDGTPAQADAWLKTKLQPLLSSSQFTQNGLLIIVFDEGNGSDNAHGGGHIAAVVVGPKVKKGYRSTVFYQHQSFLKTILEALGVDSYPGNAASANPFSDVF